MTSANTSDQAGFKVVFSAILLLVSSIVKIFADRGYRGALLDWVRETSHQKSVLEIVVPEGGRVGFAVLRFCGRTQALYSHTFERDS